MKIFLKVLGGYFFETLGTPRLYIASRGKQTITQVND